MASPSKKENVEFQSYLKLDDLVIEYLNWRGYKQSYKHLVNERQNASNKSVFDEQRLIIDRIMSSFLEGDYPRALTLWDTYIIQGLQDRSVIINNDARTAEFILNLYIAIFPFRMEVIKNAPTPKVASATAARSMTIFKHFVESRGSRLVQKDQEFEAYKNLHKIAFPPTHPQFKHLFSEDWIKTAKYRVISFLERFFSIPEPPPLCEIYKTYEVSKLNIDEITKLSKKKERDLFVLSKSLYDITADLFATIDNTKNNINRDVIINLKQKFQELNKTLTLSAVTVPPPVAVTSNNSSPYNNKIKDYKNDEALKSELVSKLIQTRNKKIDYERLSSEFLCTCRSLKEFLANCVTSTPYSDEFGQKHHQSIVETCVCVRAIIYSIIRPDKGQISKNARESVISLLIKLDIGGFHGGDINNTSKSPTKRLENGIVGYLNTFLTSFNDPNSFASETSKANGDLSDEMSAVSKLNEYLLDASEIFMEYICRLIISMTTSAEGEEYFQANSSYLVMTLLNIMTSLINSSIAYTSNENMNDDIKLDPNFSINVNLILSIVMALTVLCARSRHNQILIVKNDGITILVKLVNHFMFTNQSNVFCLEACLALILFCVSNLESQRTLISSVKKLKVTESFIKVLFSIIIQVDSGYINKYHGIYSIVILKCLLRELLMRQNVRDSIEFENFKTTLNNGIKFNTSELTLIINIIENDDIDLPDSLGENKFNYDKLLDNLWLYHSTMPDNDALFNYISNISKSGRSDGVYQLSSIKSVAERKALPNPAIVESNTHINNNSSKDSNNNDNTKEIIKSKNVKNTTNESGDMDDEDENENEADEDENENEADEDENENEADGDENEADGDENENEDDEDENENEEDDDDGDD